MDGNTSLGIELGSTRIKVVLVGPEYVPLASGTHDWENQLVGGVWTYHLEDVWAGIQDAYSKISDNVWNQYGVEIQNIGAMGVSAMMHGYLVFDADNRQLVPFRTWRNTITETAAAELSEQFDFNIPQRWSIAHLYQAILNGEGHLSDVAFMTTLAGYVHWQLTGQKVVGIGEASGMFPVDSDTGDFRADMVSQFEGLAGQKGFSQKLLEVLPKVLSAGESAGELSAKGAQMIDPGGVLRAGAKMCPPEGDAGTGMVATNSVSPHTGNVSAGTSIFAMVVLEKVLSRIYTEIDMVTTPDGKPVAMVHCNNCTSDLDAWVRLFSEVLSVFGTEVPRHELYDKLYFAALEGDSDGGGLLSYNYYSGEPITGLEEGRPLFLRLPGSKMNLPNFMRSTLYSTMATLKLGIDILTEKENVKLKTLLGHGGLFKTRGVGQKLMAAVLDVPVAVMESAGEGGPWGMAILAAYMLRRDKGEALDAFLANRVFANAVSETEYPQSKDNAGFSAYMERYIRGLDIQRAAVKFLR